MHKEFIILQDVVVHSVPDGIKTTLKKGMSGKYGTCFIPAMILKFQ